MRILGMGERNAEVLGRAPFMACAGWYPGGHAVSYNGAHEHLRLPLPVKAPLRGRSMAVLLGLAVLSMTLAGRAAAQEPDAAGQDAMEATQSLVAELARGRASWYGPKFHGRRTSSGERFDMNDLTAAHQTLPFGTRVRVRNEANGREVVVRINDRGPRMRDRIIDLSKAAAAALGFLKAGEARVVLIER
jgi:rare lipoprotein A